MPSAVFASPQSAKEGGIDPAALMAIKNLELRAKIVVQGFWNGLHRSPYHGFSVEFTEYRQYTPGDDPRYLDWRLFGRTDRYYIKKYEDETNLGCYLLVDNSRSMTFGSLSYNKAQYANTLAATLAYFLNTQGDAVGVVTFDDEIREYIPARNRPGHLRQVMLALEKPAGGKDTDLSAPLLHIAQIVKRRGLVLLISDLLAPLEQLQKNLAALAACGHEIVLFQVLDPAEMHFTFDAPMLFQDVESGRDLYIDPNVARKSYLKKLEAHLAGAQSICQRLGISYVKFATDRALELALFDFLHARLERGKKFKKVGVRPGARA